MMCRSIKTRRAIGLQEHSLYLFKASRGNENCHRELPICHFLNKFWPTSTRTTLKRARFGESLVINGKDYNRRIFWWVLVVILGVHLATRSFSTLSPHIHRLQQLT